MKSRLLVLLNLFFAVRDIYSAILAPLFTTHSIINQSLIFYLKVLNQKIRIYTILNYHMKHS